MHARQTIGIVKIFTSGRQVLYGFTTYEHTTVTQAIDECLNAGSGFGSMYVKVINTVSVCINIYNNDTFLEGLKIKKK